MILPILSLIRQFARCDAAGIGRALSLPLRALLGDTRSGGESGVSGRGQRATQGYQSQRHAGSCRLHCQRIGVDHVGIGTDFNHGSGIEGFVDASEALNVTTGLLERGYSKIDIAKIWGGNFLRVWQESAREE